MHNPWSRLYAHAPDLKQWAKKRLSAQIRHYVPVEDLISETLGYAFRNQSGWKSIPDEELGFFLRRVAHNFALNHYRKLTRGHRAINHLASQKEKGGPGTLRPGDSPSRAFHRREKKQAMSAIFERLKHPHYREILSLVWIEGCSLKEASARLGHSLGATKSLLHRAMEACRAVARRDSFAGFRVSGETV